MLSLLLSFTGGVDHFETGFFVWERRGRVPVPVRVWYGQPIDPVTAERLDRSWRWQFEFGGMTLERFADMTGQSEEIILASFWPKSRDSKIDQGRYQYLVDMGEWARENDPYSPFADRHGKVDLLTASIPDIGG